MFVSCHSLSSSIFCSQCCAVFVSIPLFAYRLCESERKKSSCGRFSLTFSFSGCVCLALVYFFCPFLCILSSLSSIFIDGCAFSSLSLPHQLLHQLLDKGHATWRSSHSISPITKWTCIHRIDSIPNQLTGNHFSLLYANRRKSVLFLWLWRRFREENDYMQCEATSDDIINSTSREIDIWNRCLRLFGTQSVSLRSLQSSWYVFRPWPFQKTNTNFIDVIPKGHLTCICFCIHSVVLCVCIHPSITFTITNSSSTSSTTITNSSMMFTQILSWHTVVACWRFFQYIVVIFGVYSRWLDPHTRMNNFRFVYIDVVV